MTGVSGARGRGLRRRFARALDLVLPHLCMACREPVDAPGRLCAACWSAVDFIVDPMCDSCGLPFDYAIGPGAVCGACARAEPAFDRARAAMRYGDVARRLVAGFKYADRLHLAPALAQWLARAAAPLLDGAGSTESPDALPNVSSDVLPEVLIVPTPLHRRRLVARRFNQSAMLAQGLARLCGVPVALDALERRRATPPQAAARSAARRRRNVAGAFRVPPHRRALVDGRRILLVDDVLTTGATVEACARALRAAGAARVDAATLARVVRDTAPEPRR